MLGPRARIKLNSTSTSTIILRQYCTLLQKIRIPETTVVCDVAEEQTSPDRVQLVLGFAAITAPREIGGLWSMWENVPTCENQLLRPRRRLKIPIPRFLSPLLSLKQAHKPWSYAGSKLCVIESLSSTCQKLFEQTRHGIIWVPGLPNFVSNAHMGMLCSIVHDFGLWHPIPNVYFLPA